MIGVGIGFTLGLLILSIAMGISGSKWWHNGHHRDGLYIFSCDHCLKIWDERNDR